MVSSRGLRPGFTFTFCPGSNSPIAGAWAAFRNVTVNFVLGFVGPDWERKLDKLLEANLVALDNARPTVHLDPGLARNLLLDLLDVALGGLDLRFGVGLFFTSLAQFDPRFPNLLKNLFDRLFRRAVGAHFHLLLSV